MRLDPAIGTAPQPYPLPRNAVARGLSASGGGLGFAPGFTPWDGGAATNDVGGGVGVGGGGGDGEQVESVEFVRSQLDGSFALF